jgi:hypothetical protein
MCCTNLLSEKWLPGTKASYYKQAIAYLLGTSLFVTEYAVIQHSLFCASFLAMF